MKLLTSLPILILGALATSTAFSATYIVTGSGPVPANTYGNTYATINLPGESTITDVVLTTRFSPGDSSTGTSVPLVAGSTFLKFELTAISSDPTAGTKHFGAIFDFPATYPVQPGQPSCLSGGPFDFSCVNSILDGEYVFTTSATTDFDSMVIASAAGGTVPSGSYATHTGFLQELIGVTADRQFNFALRTGTVYSGTYGKLDWELQVTTVPLPAAFWLFASGLLVLGRKAVGSQRS